MTTQYGKLVALLLTTATIELPMPYTTPTAPEWPLQFLDQKRRPLAGIAVSGSWQYSTFQSKLHSEARSTDVNGWAIFLPRYVRANLAQRAYGVVLKARSFVHASWGPTCTSPPPWRHISPTPTAVRDCCALPRRIAIASRGGRTPLWCALRKSRFSNCNRRARSFLALRFRHSFLSVRIPVLLAGNRDPFGPVTNGLTKKLSNGVKVP
jgi:hypothetical protein